MQSARTVTTYFQVFRSISSTSINFNLSRESTFIRKLIYGNKKSKRKWYDTNVDLRIPNAADKSLPASVVHRMNVRDKLFMKHITDLISMGELSDFISGNLEITHVKITSDFKNVNIFWLPNNDISSSSANKEILQKCAYIIRDKLSTLRVIGVIPPIQFVENKSSLLENEVIKKLALIKEELLRQPQTIDETLDEKPIEDSMIDAIDTEIPEMRNDVLGLDHFKIMSQITASLTKSKLTKHKRMLNVHRDVKSNSFESSFKNTSEFCTQKQQQSLFSEYLTSKRNEERRKYRNMKRSRKRELLNNFKDMDFNDEEDDNMEYIEKFDENIEE